MKKWLQRIRGAVGIGLTWAAGWAPVGALTGLVTAAFLHFPLGILVPNFAIMFGVLGFFGGAIFSTVLGLADGRRSFDQLSFRRFVAWGALGGFVLGAIAATGGILGAGLTVFGVVITVTSTLLGAGSAAGTLAIARGTQGQGLPKGGGARAELAGARRELPGRGN